MQLLETLRARFQETQEGIRALTDEIDTNEGGNPTDEQAANLGALNDELERLVPRIEQATHMANRMHGAAELLSGVPGNLGATLDNAARRTQPAREWDTWGAYARALASGEVDETTRNDVARMITTREHNANRVLHRRAFVDVVTGDVPGLLPPTWLTDIVDFIGTARPFITAFEQRPLPDTGMTINYPTVTQRPQVGKQATEKTDIPSRKTTVASGVANVQTFGGGEDVSVQVLQRTDPAYLGLVLELYAEEMAAFMDTTAIATAQAVIPAPNKLTVSAAAGADDITTKFVQAAGLIYAAHAQLNAAVFSVQAWAAIAGATDADGRPIFPNASPFNSAGSSTLNPNEGGDIKGLSFVVDPWMPAGIAIVGDQRAFTSMIGGVQTLSADNPSKLGVDHAVFEFAAFAARKPSALVQLTFAA
jgi:HK97 family phage major capsid protein